MNHVCSQYTNVRRFSLLTSIVNDLGTYLNTGVTSLMYYVYFIEQFTDNDAPCCIVFVHLVKNTNIYENGPFRT